MRIAYLIHSLHISGGMEKVLSVKANWFAAREGYEIYIITSHLRGRKPFFPLDERVHLVDAAVPDDFLHARKYRRRLEEILSEVNPDITVSLSGAEVFQLKKCHNGGVKVAEYHFLHDKFYRKYNFRPYAFLRTGALTRAFLGYEALVVLSSYDKDYYSRVLPHQEKIYRIPNFTDCASAEPSDLSEKRFVAVGRLKAEKNFADAVNIWEKVALKHPDWHLDIYGEGREKENLQKLILAKGLEGKVVLKGGSKTIGKEYAVSSGILITSRYEGFCLAAVEAMSCGLPVVAYDCPGGMPELLSKGEYSFIVAQGDAEAAAESICRLIEDKELRSKMGRNAFAAAREYAPDAVMAKWEELFKNLLNDNCLR